MILLVSLSVILMVKFLASLFRITITMFDSGVTKPVNSNEVSLEGVTSILFDPGGTNLLK